MSRSKGEQFEKDVLRLGRMNQMSSHWSWLYSNEYLRTVIKAKMESEKLSVAEVARRAKIHRPNLSNYLHNNNKNITDLQILKVCESLNLELSLLIDVIPVKK